MPPVMAELKKPNAVVIRWAGEWRLSSANEMAADGAVGSPTAQATTIIHGIVLTTTRRTAVPADTAKAAVYAKGVSALNLTNVRAIPPKIEPAANEPKIRPALAALPCPSANAGTDRVIAPALIAISALVVNIVCSPG
ncbi:hypothetical protein GCM10017566_52930 [Amycolatopsis bartoniae]|uniref:Uncharacterized protein n=1 Tax=Amycolatopsis bartoniae TaxID=941986 RepID=A0A8H9IX60_9PSEU|nr:hypothetical protein GCM10017566_52930 [Amycolatopsis bartoniae]